VRKFVVINPLPAWFGIELLNQSRPERHFYKYLILNHMTNFCRICDKRLHFVWERRFREICCFKIPSPPGRMRLGRKKKLGTFKTRSPSRSRQFALAKAQRDGKDSNLT
jgi:hypothetical protein